MTWKPQNTTPVNEDQANALLLDALDDLDDVQSVASNWISLMMSWPG